LQTQSVINPETPSVREFAGHRLQFALPSGDHCPAGQYLHVSGLMALKFSEYIPIEQFEQALRASWLLYVPGVHASHVYSPSACAYPGTQ
jgi:hypothetical protein